MTYGWTQWHQHYETPGSPLEHRLEVVHRELRRALAVAPGDADGIQRLVSICAGEGRDVLPVLAEQAGIRRVEALLIELDDTVAERARANAARLGVSGVEVRIGDAGLIDTYLGVPRAHVLVASGVFGNLTADDTRRTIAVLPALLVPGGVAVWTRSCQKPGEDLSIAARDCFLEHGFSELSFVTTPDGFFRVGAHWLTARAGEISPPRAGTRMFSFVSSVPPGTWPPRAGA